MASSNANLVLIPKTKTKSITTPNQTIPMPNPSHSHSLKFTPTNYLLWTIQFEPILISHDLEDIIDGFDVAPPATISVGNSTSQSNPEHLTWRKRNQRLCNWIIASLSKDVLLHIVNTSTSSEVWTCLKQAFGSPKKIRVHQLNIHLQNPSHQPTSFF
ncbi:hypothetical protein GBA52_015224 [Prunus armeniaca]|nr:hypothetical protein GBA52_015224 [Prunus armeniaca]